MSAQGPDRPLEGFTQHLGLSADTVAWDTTTKFERTPLGADVVGRAFEIAASTIDAPLESLDLHAVRQDPILRPFGEATAAELEDGLGVVLLSDFPADRGRQEISRRAYWVLMCAIGTPVFQSSEGDVMVEVTDAPTTASVAERPTLSLAKSSAALPFHTDRCDVVSLLCVSSPEGGGASHVASTVAICRDLWARRPQALERLLAGTNRTLANGRRVKMPLATVTAGRISCQYSAAYVTTADTDDDPADKAALADFAASAQRLSVPMILGPGDIQLLNSHATVHARDAYKDGPGLRRLMLRIWLSMTNSRPVAQESLWGTRSAGAVRGGFALAGGARSPFSEMA